MTRPAPLTAARTTVLALVVTAFCGGCALDRLPRIDPSGDRLLLFPDSPTAAAPVATAPAPTFADPLAGSPGNATLPPVYSDAVGGGALGAGPPGAVVAEPQDRVTLTPSRILAPVGTEVVLRAGVCGRDGYLLTNRRVEWLLARDGAGEFVTVGEQGERDFLRYPWSVPKKVDNSYAIGYTSPFYTCLRRGNIDPRDDLQVQPGDAWITVTSAAEGTSYVTAYAPGVDNWDIRRARAVIYWVDAQWQFPPSAVVPAGQAHQLTTTVTRQSDGAPIRGWVVRYEVADQSGALLGYGAGQTAEATTDAQGRATVQVTPTDSQPGSTRVRVVVVRPEQAGVASSPRVDVGTGEAVVTWSPDARPIEPSPVDPGAQPPVTPGPPSQPPFTPPQPPVTPPPAAGRPELNVRMARASQGPVNVGDFVRYTIIVENRGTAPARNLMFVDRFDDGLTNEFDTQRLGRIEYDQMSDLAPGESDSIEVEFKVTKPGNLCHDVTVTADGAVDGVERDCFVAQAVQQAAPSITLTTETSPVRARVGEPVLFNAAVQNTGSAPATNLTVTITHDGVFEPSRAQAGSTRTPDGAFTWTLPSLAPGEKKVFGLEALCRRPTELDRPGRMQVGVVGDGVNQRAESQPIEVLPPLGESPAEGAEPPADASPLRVTITEDQNPAQVGRRMTLSVTVENTSQRPQRQVQLQVYVPAELQPSLHIAQAPSGTQARDIGNRQVALTPAIAELRPGESASLLIPIDPVTQGRARVQARAQTADYPSWSTVDRVIDINPR